MRWPTLPVIPRSVLAINYLHQLIPGVNHLRDEAPLGDDWPEVVPKQEQPVIWPVALLASLGYAAMAHLPLGLLGGTLHSVQTAS